jgi:hypothetical protein
MASCRLADAGVAVQQERLGATPARRVQAAAEAIALRSATDQHDAAVYESAGQE